MKIRFHKHISYLDDLGAVWRRQDAGWTDTNLSLGIAIWTPIAVEGATMQMMHGNGFGFNWKGLYLTSLMDHHANWRERADELSESLKVTMLAGEYILRKYQGRYYAKCQNLSRVLRVASIVRRVRGPLAPQPRTARCGRRASRHGPLRRRGRL
jgi:hypothetical protein